MNKAWKTAWVIGGSTGLGAELARTLAGVGTSTYVSARDQQKLNFLTEKHENIHCFPLDVTEKDDCINVTANIFAINETLPDLIILNAAIYSPMNAENFDGDEIANMISVNYMGIVNIFTALLSYKELKKPVTIAAVTSPSGWRGLPGGLGYGSSKAAVINMMESMKPELEPYGFDLRVINPGFIKTRLTDKNEFTMPQLMSADEAAKRTMRGLSTRKFDISFPNPFIFFLKILRVLPYWLYFRIINKIR